MYNVQTDIADESFALKQTKILYPDTVTVKDTTTSSITASISRNTTDYRIDPSSGMTNSLSVEFAGLGGTNKFLRYIAQTAQYAQFVPVGLGTVFMVRGTLGHIADMGEPVTIDEKFYLGGISTVRGYDSRTISPYVRTPEYDAVTGTFTDSNRVYVGGDTEG